MSGPDLSLYVTMRDGVQLALEHAGYKALSEEDVCGRGAKAISFRAIGRDKALNYAGERADLALQVAPVLVDLLEQDGLVAFADNPNHLRAKLAMLTPRGSKTLQAITTRQVQWAQRVAATWSRTTCGEPCLRFSR